MLLSADVEGLRRVPGGEACDLTNCVLEFGKRAGLCCLLECGNISDPPIAFLADLHVQGLRFTHHSNSSDPAAGPSSRACRTDSTNPGICTSRSVSRLPQSSRSDTLPTFPDKRSFRLTIPSHGRPVHGAATDGTNPMDNPKCALNIPRKARACVPGSSCAQARPPACLP